MFKFNTQTIEEPTDLLSFSYLAKFSSILEALSLVSSPGMLPLVLFLRRIHLWTIYWKS
jgi:hypothetical protein